MALEFSQRFRRQVSPYNVVQSLAVLSGSNYCPALQTIRTSGLPDVDRASCPTVIQAVVSATSADNSGAVPSVTSSAVTNIKWMVQRGDEAAGTDITLHSAWTGKFTVGTDADKGKLFVGLNVPAGTTWRIWMECVISDQRRGYTLTVPVTTDSVLLYSIADADDKYTMSLDRPACEPYEPARDERLIHDYLVGKGQTHTLVDDGNTYQRPVTVTLRQGSVPLSASAYTVKVYRMSASGVRSESTPANDDSVSSISGAVVTFDLRFAAEGTYQIACLVDGSEVCYKTYGWVWSRDNPTTDEGIVGANGCMGSSYATYRPKLNLGGALLKYPEVGFDLKWQWRNLDNDARTYIASGERMTIDLSTANLFKDSEAEVSLSIERRGAFVHVCDEMGVALIDVNGDYLITN